MRGWGGEGCVLASSAYIISNVSTSCARDYGVYRVRFCLLQNVGTCSRSKEVKGMWEGR